MNKTTFIKWLEEHITKEERLSRITPEDIEDELMKAYYQGKLDTLKIVLNKIKDNK
jgi:hypothetical protein